MGGANGQQIWIIVWTLVKIVDIFMGLIYDKIEIFLKKC
jgi:hypothetical protein